jgi:hypothetical protein
MTIPTEIIDFAQRLEAMRAEAITLCAEQLDAAQLLSGAEAMGHEALAEELEQVGKVLGNYMPRIMRHISSEVAVEEEPEIVAEPEPEGEIETGDEA